MKKNNIIHTAGPKDALVLQGVFFLLTFILFSAFGNYVLYFQETQFLFVFSGEYLHDHLVKPGAPLEYLARLLSQFYHSRIPGALIISVILTLPVTVLYQINKKLNPGKPVNLFLMILPSAIMLALQANYYHLLEYSLGYLLILVFYLFTISSDNRLRHIIMICLFPLFYFLGGTYALIFAVLYLVHTTFISKAASRYMYSLAILVVAGITFLLFWKVIFYQPVDHLIFYPFPVLEQSGYSAGMILLTLVIMFYPFISRFITGKVKLTFKSRLSSIITASLVFLVSLYVVVKTLNPQTAQVIKIERLVFEEKWNEAIELQEKKPATNLIAEYFYNVALAETDQLCDRLFHGPQNFLAGALVLPWGDIHLDRGAYFYYAIGLMNEAHRWAYEEMIVFGMRPQNIRMLAKTNILNGNYPMARKYLDILKKTVYYRKWANEKEKLLDHPELVAADPEFGPKLALIPKNNFFIQFNEPQNNLPLILEGKPDNKKAIEYYLAGLLLTKKVEIAVSNIPSMEESGFVRIPKHIEEAVLIYYNSTNTWPDIGKLKFSPETMNAFERYFNTYRAASRNAASTAEIMKKDFGNTFWYYFHFR